MVIRLDEYRKARTLKFPVRQREEKLLCVNWSPAFGVIALSCYQNQTTQELSPQLPDDNAVIEPAFMNRVYALASQI